MTIDASNVTTTTSYTDPDTGDSVIIVDGVENRTPGTTETVNRIAITKKASAALQANATFLAIGSPNNAQVLNQVQILTRENNALIRLLLGQLDSTAGT